MALTLNAYFWVKFYNMINNFTIKAVKVHTDLAGSFSINPVHDGGYNILPGMYLQTGSGVFASAHEVAANVATVNGQFQNLLGLTLNLNEIYASVNTRLYGMNTFIAKDGANATINNADVFVMVVLWN